jgi:hypothetical protein
MESLDFRSFHQSYQEDGYHVEHFKQRQHCTLAHTFILTDQGAEELPSASHLLKKYVQEPLHKHGIKDCTVLKTESRVLCAHKIQYLFEIKFPCSKSRRRNENSNS